jgi:hypothetical protein
MINIDTDLIGNKLIINFELALGDTIRIESGLVTEKFGAGRPVRNLIDTELDDIVSQIRELQRIDTNAYNDIMKQIDQTRIFNNVSKTIQILVQNKMTGIFYTLAEIH